MYYNKMKFDIIYKNEEYSVHWELLTGYIFKQSPQDMVGQFWYIIDYIKLSKLL